MRLGVAYIVFDGVELLEHSIRQIRPHVDHINVIYQNSSWFGASASHEDLAVMRRLFSNKIIDELTLFNTFSPIRHHTPQSIMKAKEYERQKRQLGLDIAVKNECTHYLCMDVDEFYQPDQFKLAKDHIIKMGYVHTSARFINYVNIPVVHRGYDPMRVPFICKVDRSSKMSPSFFVKCDPTRGIGPSSRSTHDFDPAMLTMHHMETVRRNLNLKYLSTTRSVFKRSKTDQLIDSIQNVDESSSKINFNKIIYPSLNSVNLTHCDNVFDIPYLDWKKPKQ